jgi:hypothetical protein
LSLLPTLPLKPKMSARKNWVDQNPNESMMQIQIDHMCKCILNPNECVGLGCNEMSDKRK